MNNQTLIEELKAFGVTDEGIKSYLENLPTDEMKSISKDIIEDAGRVLAIVEYADGNPATPIAVFIRNIVAKAVHVAYTRTVEGYGTQSYNYTLQPYDRYHVGWHCITGSYSSLCSRQIYTNIVSASI